MFQLPYVAVRGSTEHNTKYAGVFFIVQSKTRVDHRRLALVGSPAMPS